MEIPNEKLNEFEAMLQITDFHYGMSDDKTYYKRGLAQVESALARRASLIKKYPESEKIIEEIFNKYRSMK